MNIFDSCFVYIKEETFRNSDTRSCVVVKMCSIFVFLAFLWNVVTGIMIAQFLDKRGIPMNFRLLRYKVFGYVRKYKEFTIKETGSVGPLYMSFNISLAVFVFFFIFTLLLL